MPFLDHLEELRTGTHPLDVLTRDPAVRNAIHDLKRLNIASSVEETEPGLLIVEVGSEALAPGTALAYELGQLYVAYGGGLSLEEHVVNQNPHTWRTPRYTSRVEIQTVPPW
jgi:hypothetical protein